ncbi:hypothetical protein Dsin_011985 [Dipteronia sinensis]|uniref:Uncharacterized protein n=1 Tax=Dipteronia sinensis TaxID=43782 RepID=A0AAE0AHT3_9ROSI|nr:hypothetical protein Dsin_011985 [Dipteronia sinensis]
MRRQELPPRIRWLQEEKLAKATPQLEMLNHQQFESLHARVEHLTRLLNIQLQISWTQEASIQELLMICQQQQKQLQQRVLVDYFQQPARTDNQSILSEPQQNKFKSNEDYSNLLSFLGMEPALKEKQMIQSELHQKKYKSDIDYSKLLSFLGTNVDGCDDSFFTPWSNKSRENMAHEHSINLKPGSYFSYQF